MVPKLFSIAKTPLMGDHEVQADKPVIKVVANASDAANRLLIEPSNP
jgi:hypothetical protein